MGSEMCIRDRDTIKKLGRPATTKEVEDTIRKRLPMCVDHTAVHLRELEEKKIVEKKFDKKLKSFVWNIPEPYASMSFQELIKKFPQLYKESLYIHAVNETIAKQLTFDDIVKILYELSGGSDTRPGVQLIRHKLKERTI